MCRKIDPSIKTDKRIHFDHIEDKLKRNVMVVTNTHKE